MEPPYVRPGSGDPAILAGRRRLSAAERGRASGGHLRDIFRDPRLQALIEQALVNNRDLMVAAANIAAAREQYRIQRAQQLPAGRRRRGRRADQAATVGSGVDATIHAGVGVTELRARPVRPPALADRRPAQPLSRDRGGSAGDAADAGRRHRHRLADLCRRREPAADRRGHRRERREERAPDPRAARRRHRPAHRPSPGGADPRQARRPTLADQRTALAQDVNLLQLLVGAPIDPAAAAAIDRRGRADHRRTARRASIRTCCCAAPTWSQAEYQLRAANAEIGAARAACSRGSR